MKKLVLLSIMAGLLLVSSCEKFLDLSPIDQIGSNGFYTNTQEVEAGVIAIYDGMQAMVMTEYALTEMRSDNSKTKNSEGEWAQFEDMNVQPTSATVSAYWSNNYNIIFRANTVLENLGVVTNSATKNQFEGEAKFARALSHFNLVRAFGDVPVIDKVIGPNDKEYFKRKSTAEVYAFIIDDLEDAIGFLPGRSGIGEGRATSGAANALLGKVYLTMGNYTAAKTALDAVVTSGNYGMATTYNGVFYSERNTEIIFAVQFIPDDAKDSEIFSYDFTWKGRASGLNYPTDDLMASLEVGDTRASTLFYFEPLAGSSGRFECGKFRAITAANSQLGGNDWIVLRYADVLLMRAEAIMAGAASTTDAVALGAVNLLRGRAGLTPLATLTKEDLLKERRVELAFENHRLYDLIRLGYADAVMGAFAVTTEANFTYSSTDLLLPIPQRERNLYPTLTQNLGYN